MDDDPVLRRVLAAKHFVYIYIYSVEKLYSVQKQRRRYVPYFGDDDMTGGKPVTHVAPRSKGGVLTLFSSKKRVMIKQRGLTLARVWVSLLE